MKTKQKEVKKQKQQQFEITKGVCFKCKGKIYPNSNYLKLITMNDAKVVEEVWFHLPSCWQEFNQEKVNQRFKDILNVGARLINRAGVPV